MSERSLIAITGTGGSGKTNLACGLEQILHSPGFPVEHISVGEYIRQQAQGDLGHHAIASHYRQSIVDHLNRHPLEPLHPDIIAHVVAEQLYRSHAEVILLDGYPRFKGQIEQLYELCVIDDIYAKGAIITHVNEDEAVRRMLKRDDERHITPQNAHLRYRLQQKGIKEVRAELEETNLKHVTIDTYHSKEETLHEGYDFIEKTLWRVDPPQSTAS